ncbi:MAG: hypothetical protein JNL88_06375 [Bacteroidia bacterium]|nr:hypothetical protein [Bacteroidia bacterium]
MNTLLKAGLFLSLTAILSACNKQDDESAVNTPLDPSLDYFPSDSGITRYYQVDSVYWDEFFSIRDTVSYSLKEVHAGTFIDNQGRLAQRIERFKADSSGNWIIYKVWSSYRDKLRAEKVEDNIRLVKLVFPCSTGVNWNGNAYNILGARAFEYQSVGVPGSMNSLSFSETVRVIQDDEPANLLNDYYAEERYARSVGMYYRIISDLGFSFLTGDTISGSIYTEKLTSYSP